MDFSGASAYIINRLQRELNPALAYHCVGHTLAVYEATCRLAESENINPHDKILLETAALYHDAGMIAQYKDHEAASVVLARKTLPGFGYSNPAIDEIASLIMVTKLPQRAHTHLEQIICDADLDYLGQDDFFINSFKLRLEWQVNGIKSTTLTEWFDIQIKFLSEHQYFTKSAILFRNEKKLKHLNEIKELISHNTTNCKS